MRRLQSGWADDRGESLVEILVALVILGIAGVAILAGLEMSVKTSDIHRKEATGGAYVRSFAEAIQNYVDTSGGYKSCASAAASYNGVAVPDLPAGYTKNVTAVQSWNGSTWGACTGDGVQQLKLTVSSSDHRAAESLTVILRQPCNGDATSAGADPCS